jgi:GNAT superfamily N-acetyltransferase
MLTPYELREGQCLVSTDPLLLDIDRIHAFLTASYWSKGVPLNTVISSIDNSIPFGLYRDGEQIGFGRVITDRTTFAYVADVYVEDKYQGQGLGKLLMRAVMAYPDLQGLRRWMLGTRDAHGLYRQFGFTEMRIPDRWMEKADPDVYKRAEA